MTTDTTKKSLDLSKIICLYRANDTLGLYGIPYSMRPQQQPRDLLFSQTTKTYGHASDMPSWAWLGSPGWWGNYKAEDQERINAFLAPFEKRKLVPGGPHEWIDLSRALADELDNTDAGRMLMDQATHSFTNASDLLVELHLWNDGGELSTLGAEVRSLIRQRHRLLTQVVR